MKFNHAPQPIALAAVFVLVSMVAARIAAAAVVTIPGGLQVGDQYRLAFVTSVTSDALATDIGYYNAFVTAAAESVPELAALGTTWRVIGSTDAVDARDNTGTNPLVSAGVPIFRLDGVMAVQDNNDLWDGGVTAPINLFETGEEISSGIVWTGTDVDGTAYFNKPLGSNNPANGHPSDYPPIALDHWIISYSPAPSLEPGHFYAVSGVLTVPEPGSLVLAGTALAAVLGWKLPSRRRRRG